MAIVLVEQYFEFARNLADIHLVTDRAAVVVSGHSRDMDEQKVRGYLAYRP